MRYVAFDTSTLSNLTRHDWAVDREEFDAASLRLDVRPVHGLSLFQAMLDRDVARVRERFLGLNRLGFAEHPVLAFHGPIRRDEHAGKQVSLRLYNHTHRELFDLLPSEVDFASEIRTRQPAWRAIMHRLRRDHGAELVQWWHRLPLAERQQRRRKLGAPAITSDIVGAEGVFTRHILDHGPDAPAGYAATVAATPLRHRCNLAIAGLQSLFVLASIMHGEHTPNFPWLQSELDDRNDLNIVASAAYCDVFVTDDGNLLQRLRFLAERGCVFFNPMTTREFLRRTQPDA